MSNTFNILDHEVVFSDEKINYVKLQWEYQRLADYAYDELDEILPGVKHNNPFTSTFDGIVSGLTLCSPSEVVDTFKYDSPFSNKDYGAFECYTEIRDEYVGKYYSLVKKVLQDIVDELEKYKVYIETIDLAENVFSDCSATEKLRKIAEKIENHSERCSDTNLKYVNQMRAFANTEEYDYSNSDRTSHFIYDALMSPLNDCFFAIFDSSVLNDLSSSDGINIHSAVKRCANKVFSNEEVQDALLRGLRNDIFNCFFYKYKYFKENGICDYEKISSEEIDNAARLYNIYSNRSLPAEDEKDLMVQTLQANPFKSVYFTAILDKYYDPNGEIQRLAETLTIDFKPFIENKLLDIYNNGNIGTLESTLDLKNEIIEAQNNFCLEDSKAFHKVLYRQYFLELSRKASTFDETAVVNAYSAIKEGNNDFVEDKGSEIPDEDCILILSRRFRRINAAKYHDLIRDLGLTDDTPNEDGEKSYAFYEEGEDYISFEDECEEITCTKLEHDEDLTTQNYSEDKLSSDEVILGYFHYTRALDIISDGKTLLITNKRIYTTKEKFIEFSDISECRPVKKALFSYLSFERNDGSIIKLPVSKELMVSAADMINRLISALKGTDYVANSVEVVTSKTLDNAKESLIGAAASAKKGFGSLFKKVSSKVAELSDDKWTCKCGSVNTGDFCSKCGEKRKE